MPVLRRRETISSTVQGSAVAYRGNPLTESMGRDADTLARMASDYARGMAAGAEAEATALAQAAAFSTGPDGLPQLPPDPTQRMGKIAQRTYRGHITDQFVQQMGTSIKAGLNQLANEHQYDTDAYIEAANAYIADAAAGVPEGFQGAFQQITTGLKVEHASGIGHRQGQQAIQEAAATPSPSLAGWARTSWSRGGPAP